MGRRSIWELFVKESYRIFCSRGSDDLGRAVAYKNLHEDVIDGGLSPRDALHELADPIKVGGRLGDAYRIIEEGSWQKMGKEFEGLISTLESLQEQNTELHEKLDKANEMLVLARKRAIRYFKIGLTISASSIALGIATRFGYLDGTKKHIDGLFSKQATQEQGLKSSGSETSDHSRSFDLLAPQESLLGLQYPDTLKKLEDGASILLPNGNSICLKRPAPIPCKQASPLNP